MGKRIAISAMNRIRPRGTAPFGNVFDDVISELHHVVAISQFEFVRKGLRQPLVNACCKIHSATLAIPSQEKKQPGRVGCPGRRY